MNKMRRNQAIAEQSSPCIFSGFAPWLRPVEASLTVSGLHQSPPRFTAAVNPNRGPRGVRMIQKSMGAAFERSTLLSSLARDGVVVPLVMQIRQHGVRIEIRQPR